MHEKRIAAQAQQSVTAITLCVAEIEQVAARMLARNDKAIAATDRAIDQLGWTIRRCDGLVLDRLQA